MSTEESTDRSGLLRSSHRWPMASRDWINPSVWPFSCSCTADFVPSWWIKCTAIRNWPNCFRDHRGCILRSRQIRRITAGQRRCSLARCCSLSDYFDESFNWVFLKGLTQVAWTHCSVLQELWWGGRNHSQLKTYLLKSITALLGGENARGSFGLRAPSTLMNY